MTDSKHPAIDEAAVEIFTDGACRGNPGIGGWGALLQMNGKERELSGGEALTTNNRMELTGAIRALEALKRPCRVILHTDSKYVQQGISEWVHNWKRRGWKTASPSRCHPSLTRAIAFASIPSRDATSSAQSRSSANC